MPSCPKCGSEYRPGLVACPDCGRAIVATEPVPPALVQHTLSFKVRRLAISVLAQLACMIVAAVCFVFVSFFVSGLCAEIGLGPLAPPAVVCSAVALLFGTGFVARDRLTPMGTFVAWLLPMAPLSYFCHSDGKISFVVLSFAILSSCAGTTLCGAAFRSNRRWFYPVLPAVLIALIAYLGYVVLKL